MARNYTIRYVFNRQVVVDQKWNAPTSHSTYEESNPDHDVFQCVLWNVCAI